MIAARGRSTARGVGPAGCFRPPKPTGPLTGDHPLNEESESFGPRFRPAVATFKVAFGPRLLLSKRRVCGSWLDRRKPSRERRKTQKRPAADLSAPGVYWLAGRFRGRTESSPNETLFETTLGWRDFLLLVEEAIRLLLSALKAAKISGRETIDISLCTRKKADVVARPQAAPRLRCSTTAVRLTMIDLHIPPMPRMPPVGYPSDLRDMGVMSPSCTTQRVLTTVETKTTRHSCRPCPS